METILNRFTFLTDEQFGTITKLCLKYSAGKEINRDDAKSEMLAFFHTYVKKDLDRMIKARNRMKKGRKEGKKDG